MNLRRRTLMTLLGGWPTAAAAQPSRPLRLGVVSGQPRSGPLFAALEKRLAALGHREGATYTVDYVEALDLDSYGGHYRRLAATADLLVAGGPEATLASALAATRSKPIVFVAIDYDPIGLGYAQSLARPGGNVTGVFLQQIELAAKRIQVLKDAFPSLPAAAMFWDRASADQWNAARDAAARLGLKLVGVELKTAPYDYDRALDSVPEAARGMLVVPASPFFFLERQKLGEFAIRRRIGSMFVFREWVVADGLFSYGPSITDMYARAADYVDRIARGAKPADLPIEQPTVFELVVNARTARVIGLALPRLLTDRADETIE